MRDARKKIWIDHFQTALFIRIVLYVMLYQVALCSLVLIERSVVNLLEEMIGPRAGAFCFGFMVLFMTLLGVLLIRDLLKASHRLIGPLRRFRKTIQAVTAGDTVPLVGLREGDYLQDMRDEFNSMLLVLEQRGAVVLKTAEPDPTDHHVVAV